MTAQELADYIKKNIPTFINIRVVGEGVAYHYTDHYDLIMEFGGFKGHPITPNLDQTQLTIPSTPSTDIDGVVFAYENIHDAMEEGFGCDIIEITYKAAVIATHSQEATMGAPPTVMILCKDIVGYKKIETE